MYWAFTRGWAPPLLQGSPGLPTPSGRDSAVIMSVW